VKHAAEHAADHVVRAAEHVARETPGALGRMVDQIRPEGPAPVPLPEDGRKQQQSPRATRDPKVGVGQIRDNRPPPFVGPQTRQQERPHPKTQPSRRVSRPDR
jgi:hypothetical protein